MDSSRTLPGRSFQSQPKPHHWANLVGSAIALLTLTIPPTIITYYSINDPFNGLLTNPAVGSEHEALERISEQPPSPL